MHKSDGYYYAADLIRAVAIVFVVIIHVFSQYMSTPGLFLSADWWFANSINAASRVAVPLFIMLSGFLLLHSEKNYSTVTFLKKRFYKIGIPIVLWPLLYYFWVHFVSGNTISVSDFIERYLTVNIYYHLYFLFIMVGLYLITPIIKIVTMHGSLLLKKYMLLLSLIFGGGMVILNYFSKIGINLATVFTVFLPYIFYFLAGDYFRTYTISKRKFFLLGVFFLLLTGVTAIITVFSMQAGGWSSLADVSKIRYNKYIFDYTGIGVMSLSVTAFLWLLHAPQYLLFLNHRKIEKLIHQLAKTSFGIYLIHPIFFYFINKYIQIIPYEAIFPVFLIMILKTILVLLISYGVIRLIQKLPISKFLFG